MKTYTVTGLREYWNLVTIQVRAASEKTAKSKFRRKVNGKCTSVRATLNPA